MSANGAERDGRPLSEQERARHARLEFFAFDPIVSSGCAQEDFSELESCLGNRALMISIHEQVLRAVNHFPTLGRPSRVAPRKR
jgi:hypothetical protein